MSRCSLWPSRTRWKIGRPHDWLRAAKFVAASSDIALVRILVANKKVVVGPKEKAQIAKLKKAGGFIGGMGQAG